MKIIVICEGSTEEAIRSGLREFVQARATSVDRIGLQTRPLDGPTVRNKLQAIVRNCFEQPEVVGVVALTDVYPAFKSATDAKDALRRFAGTEAKREGFKAHAAQYEVEAWILPAWDQIAKHLGAKASPPGAKPEQVNGQKPPSHHLRDLFRRAKRDFEKVTDGPRWLTGDMLAKAADSCPELKSFLNSLLEFAGAASLT